MKRSLPVLLVVLVCVLALVGGVWVAGGFNPATGRLFRQPVGTEVNMGPLSISVDRARAQETYGGEWSIYVIGRCRNNTDEPVSGVTNNLAQNGFSAQHPVTREVKGEASLFFGRADSLGSSPVLNPGTPMVPCQLVFRFDNFPGTDVVFIGVSQMKWLDRSPTGEREMVWSADRVGWRFDVPVVTEPREG